MTTGYNGEGQLGNGTIINQTTPVNYQLPSGVKAERMFTNFLSHGRYLFVKGSDGNLYAAGRNVDGELGIGRYSTYEATASRAS
jgi:alpha-tubulin suppressor-like RCC1 family protein